MQIKKIGYIDEYMITGNEGVKEGLPVYTDSSKINMVVTIVVKMLFAFLLTHIIYSFMKYITNFIFSLSFLIEKIKYELVIFLYLCMLLFMQNPGRINDWVSAWYVLNYKDGIGSRLLIGTILNFFFGEYITHNEVFLFVFCTLTILIGFVSFLAGRVIRSSNKDKSFAVFFIAMYLACPGSIAYLWTSGNMGRLETYSLVFFLFGVVLFEIYQKKWIRYFLIFLFSELALLTHQGTIFYYYPIVVTVLLYDLYRKFSWKQLLAIFANFIGVLFTFFYLQLFSGLNYSTVEIAVNAVCNRTNMEIVEDAIRLEYFSSLKENFDYGQVHFFKYYGYEWKTGIALILLAPLILFIVGIWRKYVIQWKKEVTNKNIYKSPVIYILFSNLLYIPIYLLMCDWGRWTGALIGTLFFQIGYLYAKQDSRMRNVFYQSAQWVEKYKFVCIIILLYLASLDKFTDLFTAKINNLYVLLFG